MVKRKASSAWLCCSARCSASSRVMCADAAGFCAGETEAGAGGAFSRGSSCPEAVAARASSPAAKATTIFIVEKPLGSVPRRRIFVKRDDRDRGANCTRWEGRAEKWARKTTGAEQAGHKGLRGGKRRARGRRLEFRRLRRGLRWRKPGKHGSPRSLD